MMGRRGNVLTVGIAIALLLASLPGIAAVTGDPARWETDDLPGSGAEVPTDGQTVTDCGDREERPPISITSDAMFKLGPAVGVVNPHASGTADDPYVIEGWCIGTAPVQSFSAGITIRNTAAHVVVRDNVVDPDRGFLEDEVPVTIDPVVDRTTGVALTDADNVKIADNTIVDHSEAGVHVNASSTVQVAGNTLENNTEGALLEDSTDVTVDANTIQNHPEAGVRVNASSAVRIVGNTLENSTHGALLEDSTDVTVDANTIEDHTDAGVRVDASSAVRIVRNTLENDGITGAWLDGSEDVTIGSNRIADHSYGILAFEANGTDVENNTITGTIQATILSDVDGMTIADNVVRDNSGGLALWEVSNASITANNVTGHNGYGVVVFFGDDLALTENRLTDNGAPGTDLFYLSKATVTNNTVTNNSHGIRLYEVASGRVADNAVTGNDEDALEIFQSSRVPVTGNNVEDNGGRGLNVIGGDQPVDARGNWWGDATGPSGGVTDACTGTVADGDGAEILTDNVLGEEGEVCFDPWLDAPNPDAGAP